MFVVYDLYETREFLGRFNSKKEAYKCAEEREKDTDGECYCVIYATERSWEEQ